VTFSTSHSFLRQSGHGYGAHDVLVEILVTDFDRLPVDLGLRLCHCWRASVHEGAARRSRHGARRPSWEPSMGLRELIPAYAAGM
jgi:hypothetical protein